MNVNIVVDLSLPGKFHFNKTTQTPGKLESMDYPMEFYSFRKGLEFYIHLPVWMIYKWNGLNKSVF